MYEISFILGEENAAPVEKALSAREAKILGGEELRKMRLAYPMKKHDYGFFGTFQFEVDPEALEKIFADLKLEKDVLRYMVTRSQEREAEAVQLKKASEFPVSEGKKTEEVKRHTEPVLTNEELEKKIEEILQ